MYYLGKKDDYFRIKCEKCNKVLLFDKKYFVETYSDDFCKSNTPLQCSCGNVTNGVIKSNKIDSSSNINLPRCPTCSSTNIEKISGANKAASVAVFGILSLGHISKTFKCKNCGMKF